MATELINLAYVMKPPYTPKGGGWESFWETRKLPHAKMPGPKLQEDRNSFVQELSDDFERVFKIETENKLRNFG